MTAPDEDLLRSLLATPPANFVAERNRFAKQLRTDGEREAGKAVAALKRPTVADWALNVVANEHPDEVDTFVDAAAALDEAQTAALKGEGGDDVRSLLGELRQASTQLVHLAQTAAGRAERTAAGSSIGVLTTRLSDIAGNAAARELLRSGLLGAEDPGIVEPFGVRESSPTSTSRSPRERPRRAATSKPAAKDDGRLDDEAEARAEAEAKAEERRARMRALATAERAHAAAVKWLEGIDARLERFETAVTKAEAQVEEARARLDDALARHRAANDELGAAQERRHAAAGEVEATQAAIDDARRTLEADADDPTT